MAGREPRWVVVLDVVLLTWQVIGPSKTQRPIITSRAAMKRERSRGCRASGLSCAYPRSPMASALIVSADAPVNTKENTTSSATVAPCSRCVRGTGATCWLAIVGSWASAVSPCLEEECCPAATGRLPSMVVVTWRNLRLLRQVLLLLAICRLLLMDVLLLRLWRFCGCVRVLATDRTVLLLWMLRMQGNFL